MADITWPIGSAPGAKPQENAGRLINCFAEPLGEGARAAMVRRRVAGLSEIASTGLFRCRGLHSVGGTLLAAFTGQMARIDLDDGSATPLGVLGGDDRITIASNNAASPDIVAVTDLGAYNLFAGSAPTAFADPDLPAGPACVAFQDGYFFFGYADGRIFASGLNAVTVNALDFTTFQVRPGGVMRLIPFGGDLLAFGPFAIGVYRNLANPVAFPYSLGDTIGKGLAGKFAVAGFEEGWVNELLWVGDDNVVYRLQGYSPVPVSTPDVVRAIAAVEDKGDLDALVYMNGSHPVWAISGPGFTWELNLATGRWNERHSHGAKRWLAQSSIRFGGEWVVGAIDSGKLFRIADEFQTEDGRPLVVEIWSQPAAGFPGRFVVPRAEFDFVVGVGREAGGQTEREPRVAISWSDDGGATWSTPLLRSLGGEGEFHTRISLLRTGLTGPQGRQWRVVISDPVYVGLLGGGQASDIRTA